MIKMFGGSKGFTDGVPNNIFAALHKSVTGNEANCSTLGFDPMTYMWASAVSTYRAKNTRITGGNLLGAATNYVVKCEGNGPSANLGLLSEVPGDMYLTNLDVTAANASTADLVAGIGNNVGAPISVDTSTSVITITGGGVVPPPTGFPFMFKNATNDANLPGGLLASGQTMYCIRLSSTTFKAARTKEQALSGNAVSITSAGTGANYMIPNIGACLSAFGGSHIFVDPTVRVDNARQVYLKDSWPGTPYGSSIFGVPRVGPGMSQQQATRLTLAAGNGNAQFAGVQIGITGEKWYSPTGTQINT